ncbi:MAG: DUF3347 domain-containing protein [Saprospiraceae bacterium]|nr:DUF3347 domain-containing protein [Saprospiraceae bacterium]
MSNIILSFTMLATVLINSCSAQKNTTTQTTLPVETMVVKTDSTTAVAKTDTVKTVEQITVSNPISEVYADYIGLKNSLTKDNADSAAAYAKKLIEDVDKVQMDKLNASQHAVWMKHMKDLSYHAEFIKSTVELEHQREHFISLSKTMYDLLKKFNANSETVYYQYCPMANDGKGAYWISENSKIVNPYFGKQMLGCGSTKETITVK